MDRSDVLLYIQQLKKQYNVRVYTPFKYFHGLSSKRQIKSRFLDILKGRQTPSKDPKSYLPFQTDLSKSTNGYRKTFPSKYTRKFESVYGTEHTSLSQKAKVSGVPLDILQKVFRKGKAAWRTGHRVGANENQWGYARVHSFLVLGCTTFSSDFKLFEEALSRMKPKARRQWLDMEVHCPKSTLASPHYRKRKTYEKFLQYKKYYLKK